MKKDNEKDESKETAYLLIKDPCFYLMIFLWLFAFCSGVYAILIGVIVPY